MSQSTDTERGYGLLVVVWCIAAVFFAITTAVLIYLLFTHTREHVVINNEVSGCCCSKKTEGGLVPSSNFHGVYEVQEPYHAISFGPFEYPNYWPVVPTLVVEPYPVVPSLLREFGDEAAYTQSIIWPPVVVVDNWFIGGSALPAIPEPQSWLMLIVGFGVVGLMIRKKHDQQTA